MDPIVEMGKVWAGRAYPLLRARGHTPDAALGEIYLATMNSDAPDYVRDLSVETFQEWAAEGAWETIYRNQARVGADDRPAPLTDLSDHGRLARAEQMARDMTEAAFLAASKEDASVTEMARWRETQKLWMQSSADLRAYDERQEVKVQAEQLAVAVRERRTEIVDRLNPAYGQLGPQYEILVDRLAGVEAYLKVVEEQPTIENIDRYLELSRTSVALVNQLQKYTEAVKMPQLEAAREEGVVAVLRVLELKLAPRQPELYREMVDAITDEIGAPEEALALP